MNLQQAREVLVELGRDTPVKPGTVLLDLSGPIARLSLDNGAAKNAVTLQMMVQLADAVEALSQWRGAALILDSRHGGLFCSGGHLGQVRHAIDNPERAAQMHRAMSTVLDQLLALPLVSVSVIEGPAIGGGAELSTATDFRFMGPQSSLRFVHASLGIAPGWGGTARLVQHVGRGPTLKILVQSKSMSPQACEAVGLATFAQKPCIAAGRFLAEIAQHPPEAIRAIKTQVRQDRDPAVVFSEVWGAAAHQRALDTLRAHQK